MISIGSLCSGMGALDRALSAHLARQGTPARFAWHAETDPAAAHVLKVHHPTVPNVGDLTVADWSTVERVDALDMGVPCQPTSAAGRQLGDRDPRWLWPDARRAVAELAPRVIGFENVANLVSFERGRLWHGILDDLQALGYWVAWGIFGACLVGACHHRHRVFALAKMRTDPYGGPWRGRWSGKACGAPRGRVMLPSPFAHDGRVNGVGTVEYARSRIDAGRGTLSHLAEAGDLLSTPSASSYGSNQGGAAGRVGPVRNSLDSMARHEHFGRYAGAVARWEATFGPAPEPTELGPRGGRRLAAPFPEWMMGVAPGYVTAHVERNDALRIIGNGVHALSAYHAFGELAKLLD